MDAGGFFLFIFGEHFLDKADDVVSVVIILEHHIGNADQLCFFCAFISWPVPQSASLTVSIAAVKRSRLTPFSEAVRYPACSANISPPPVMSQFKLTFKIL